MRSRVEIITEILDIGVPGAKKTHLVYKANLNFNIVKKYLSFLVDEKGYMEKRDGKYYTTEKGQMALKHLAGASKLVS